VGTALIAAAAYEFYAMTKKRGTRPFTLLGIAACAVAFNLPWITPGKADFRLLVAAVAGVAFLLLFFRQSRANALADLAVTLFGVVYVGILASYVTGIFMFEAGGKIALFYIAVSKSSDIGGYLAGRLAGRHKLALSISPNKTIEGSLGGIALSLMAAFLLQGMLPAAVPGEWLILFALAVNIASQFGDLSESVIKRSCEVKDSAVFLPAVCGALDLIDSLLLSAPVAFYMLSMHIS